MNNPLKKQCEAEGVIVPAAKRSTALTSGASPVSAYLAAHGVGMGGTFFKFDKDKFKKSRDGEEIPEGTKLVVVYDQIQTGWIRFFGEGNPPERKMGNLFHGFVPPTREELGDMDQSQWEISRITGKPDDPWQFRLMLPLQNVETGELLIFETKSRTGRRAGDALIVACERMQRAEPDYYPVIKLRVGGYHHKQFGWIKTPAFDRVDKVSKADTAMGNVTLSSGNQPSDDLDDDLPF